MRPADRFRAGSTAQPFFSVVVLHLDLAAAQPPVLAPGTGVFHSNTKDNLLGLIIESTTGRSWRDEVTRRIVRPLRLTRTDLPAPGRHSIERARARLRRARRQDDRSDPRRPLDCRRCRRLCAGHPGPGPGPIPRRTPRGPAVPPPGDAALDAGPGPGAGRGRPGRLRAGHRTARPARRAELIGHLGGTTGYRSFVGRVRPVGVTLTFALNAEDDPTPLVIPAVRALAATRR
jgi:CubicO group peptidase (beta-lactamase class C family)